MMKISKFFNDYLSSILGILALIVSCVAIYQTRTELQMQREHNYKSVRPIAQIRILIYEDKTGVLLENKGVGPLLINVTVQLKME